MKKGFTLVEIIISVALIAVIGTVSLFSFNLIKKHNKEKTLSSMSDDVLTAVNVYVETNSDVKDELYESKNGLKIPLTTLENSGLIDFQDIKLTEEDYVVTMLGSTYVDDDHCAETYTAKSWDIKSGETIYICEKANGSQNLVTVAGDADNLSKVTRKVWVFANANPRNYIKYMDNTYRIMYIDSDDSLTLYKETGDFSGVFTEEQTLPIEVYSNKTEDSFSENNVNTGYMDLMAGINSSTDIKGVTVSTRDFSNVSTITITSELQSSGYTSYEKEISSYLKYKSSSGWSSPEVQISVSGYKIRLNSCMQIVSGTGSIATPYILKAVNC